MHIRGFDVSMDDVEVMDGSEATKERAKIDLHITG